MMQVLVMSLMLRQGINMENRNKEVQRKLRYLLDRDLVTMRKIAGDIDINYSNLSNFKNGRNQYSETMLNRIESYLDLWLEFEVKLDKHIDNI